MCKSNQTRRQFLRTASMASMAGFYVSPFLSGTQLARRHGAGQQQLRLSRAGLHLSAGRQ